jgi:hypothetical protein
VEGVVKPEQPGVQVVAEFVEQRPEERSKGDDLTPVGRPHPDGDRRGAPPPRGRVQAVELSPSRVRPGRQDDDGGRRDHEGPGERLDQARCRRLDPVAVLACQRLGHAPHER